MAGYYQHRNADRDAEHQACIRANLSLEAVSEVVLVSETTPPAWMLQHPKLRNIPVETIKGSGRPCRHTGRFSFEQGFRLADTLYGGRTPEHVVVLHNLDIEFDATVALLEHVEYGPRSGRTGTLVCLSRHEMNGMAPFWNVHHPETYGQPHFHWPNNSHDAWAFRPPLPRFRCDWAMGIPGCDCRLAHEAAKAGLRLLNPFLHVNALHRHSSFIRGRKPGDKLCIRGPYRKVAPSGLNG